MAHTLTSPLSDKVALVTGGARGIGRAIATRLAADGASIAISYSASADAAGALVKSLTDAGGKAAAFLADSAEPSQAAALVDRVVARFGRLDILVNNAGAFVLGGIDADATADQERMMRLNVQGAVAATRAATRHLPRGGRIINDRLGSGAPHSFCGRG